MRYSEHDPRDSSESLPFESHQYHDQRHPSQKTSKAPIKSGAASSESAAMNQEKNQRDSSQYRHINLEDDILKSLNGAFNRGIAGVKATFDRMVDHAKAFLTGIGTQVAAFFIPSKVDLTLGFTFLTTYLGMIMLFPARPNRFALGIGLVAGLFMILSGLWPLAPLIGGLVAAISGIKDTQIDNKAFWFTIPFSLLLLVGSVATQPESILNIIPITTLVGLLLLILFGLGAPKSLRRKLSYYLMNEAEKSAYREEELAQEAAVKAQEEAKRLTAEKAQKYALFERHIEILTKIEEQVPKLPADLSDQVVEIGLSSVKIIKAMEKDPRDILVGGRFLNRYLPIIQENLAKYITVTEYAPPETQQALHLDLIKSMATLQQAFNQLTLELIENDVHDLKIDLNVIDTLVRSQGFEIKK